MVYDFKQHQYSETRSEVNYYNDYPVSLLRRQFVL